jgi:hypothetical protein
MLFSFSPAVPMRFHRTQRSSSLNQCGIRRQNRTGEGEIFEGVVGRGVREHPSPVQPAKAMSPASAALSKHRRVSGSHEVVARPRMEPAAQRPCSPEPLPRRSLSGEVPARETRSRFRRLRSPPKWGRARRGGCRGDPGIQASSRQAKRRRIALPPLRRPGEATSDDSPRQKGGSRTASPRPRRGGFLQAKNPPKWRRR